MLRRLGQFLPIVCQAKPLSWSTPRSAPSSSPAPDTRRPSQAGLPFAKPNEDASFGDERAFSEPRSQAVVPDGEAQMMASEKGQLGKGGPDVRRAPKTTLCLLDHATWCRVGHTKKKKTTQKQGAQIHASLAIQASLSFTWEWKEAPSSLSATCLKPVRKLLGHGYSKEGSKYQSDPIVSSSLRKRPKNTSIPTTQPRNRL